MINYLEQQVKRMKTIIKNANIVNEGMIFCADVLISNERIEKIAPSIGLDENVQVIEIDADGLFLLPGMIDDQVHFREPGLTHKATINSESKAAIAGGITSFMDMPNTIPNVLTQELLEEKYKIASNASLANYSFFMGVNHQNIEEVLKTDNEKICGVTDDGLYFDDEHGILANYPEYLDVLFSRSNSLIALHSENDAIIKANTDKYKRIFGYDIPIEYHSEIRSAEACFIATKNVIEISKKHQNRLHFFHISTLAEANLFEVNEKLERKRITAEACIHHLCFSKLDYKQLGSKIKWNPSVKTIDDNIGLLKALIDGRIDIIATDHAPHTIQEKNGSYFKSMSGGPLVQHALCAMLELYHQNKISLEKIVEKMSHNVALIYKMVDRGFIREGFYADLVLVDLNNSWKVDENNLLYKCKWSPFENYTFQSKVVKTFVNGNLIYNEGMFNEQYFGQRLSFEKFR